ncbi:MAG: tetratricopeptide repeat protein [Xanthobacteraceae bacterium]
MRQIVFAGLLLAAIAFPAAARAQADAPQPLPLIAQADKPEPTQRTETKPFVPHTTHPPSAHAKSAPPWYDISAMPIPILADDLGDHEYPITANEQAGAFFNQGLILAYGFNHLEALRAFRYAQQLDPDCAMCFWGEAYVLGPNLNLPMDEKAAPIARAAATKAVEKAAKATPKEQALAAAMLKRYADSGERAALDRAYAEAMRDVARKFPDDPDIATLAAESLMLLSPWDYWQDNGRTGKEHTPEAVRLLEGALAQDPDHIAATHFYIHLVEASDKPSRAEPYADRLRGAVPGAGHLVHMPSHIYLRLGRYKDALEVNKDAVEADEHYVAANPGVQGPYPAMYYPHNVHFYMTAALMAGHGKEALQSAEKLARLISDDEARAIPLSQPIKQAPYFIHAQFSDPQAILALPQPNKQLPFVVAGWRYARGIAQALLGNASGAEQEADAIQKLASEDLSALEQALIPAKGILKIAEDVVRAKAAMARGDNDAARRFAEAAVKTQDELPYMEPPYWYVPVNQTLGAILLKNGDARAAAAAFKQACTKAPNNAWALYGLMRAQKAAGDSKAAEEARARFENARADGGQEPSLDRM